MERLRGFEVVSEEFRKFPGKLITLPKRKTKGAMACDLYSNETIILDPGEIHHFVTDVKAYMPENEALIMNIRSSIGFNKNLMLVNTQGWIDSDFYENPDNDGNIGIALKNMGSCAQLISDGERIAQGMFIKFEVPDDDAEHEKADRVGGIGSTGTK